MTVFSSLYDQFTPLWSDITIHKALLRPVDIYMWNTDISEMIMFGNSKIKKGSNKKVTALIIQLKKGT
jgi:hypothetical protein